MEYLIYVIIFIFGASIGSFLNVCIYRIPEGLSIVKPPSRCPSCKTQLTPPDLIPIFSWIFLKGKCRHCGAKISPRYMLVEALTGALFVLAFITIGFKLYLIAALTLTALLIAVAFIDIDTQTIPNGLMLFGLAAGMLFVAINIAPAHKIGYVKNALDALYGLLAGFVPLFLINVIAGLILKKEGMGGGDMKLMAVAGLFLGLKLTVVAMVTAIYLGGIVGIVIIVKGRIKAKKEATEKEGDEENGGGHYMAFGPFLALGTFTAMLYGEQILNWYLNLILH